MSLIAELQRRSVFKVGAAYLVVGWLLIQVTATIAPQMGLPGWAPRLVTLLILIGFPIALVVAWVFEVTPEGLRVETASVGNKRMFTFAAVLAALAIGWFLRSPGDAGEGGSRVAIEGAAARSIAVLPFANMSGDPSHEYFSDGISEEILNVLARTPELSVAARTSSFAYKGKTEDIPKIARELKVRMVLEGSVRKQGDRVRITAQLIDAETGYHAWSQTYDRDLKDIFVIQDEIARAIGEELKVRVGGAGAGAAVSGTQDVVAHDLYLRGLALWQERREATLWQAVETFEKAIAQDPRYAQAFAGLALTYAVLPDYSSRITYEAASLRVRDAAERALALDPTLAETYAALSNAAASERRYETSRMLVEQALVLRPSYATARQWYGNTLVFFGDIDGAVRELSRARELDPRSLIVANNLAAALMQAGRLDDAIATCLPVLDYAPESSLCPQQLATIHLLAGRAEAARPYFERWARLSGPRKIEQVDAFYAALEGRTDRTAFGRELVATPNRSWYDAETPYLFADFDLVIMLMVLEQRELVLQYIASQSGTDGGVGQFATALLLAVFDPIRCEPRFVAAMARLRVVDPRQAKVCGAQPKAGT